MTPRSRHDGVALGIMVALSVLALWYAVWVIGAGGIVDDAFIAFRYARNLVGGHGMVYNPGEHVEGYTDFLWALLAGGGLALGADPLRLAQATSLIAQVGTLWLVFALGRSGDRSPFTALIAPAMLVTQISFDAYPMTGMESSLFTFLATAILYQTHRAATGPAAPSRGRLVFLLLGLCLTRFDGLGLALVLLAAHAHATRDRRGTVRMGLALVFLLVPYHVWRVAYYGSLLPNTFHAKVGFTPDRLLEGVRYVLHTLDRQPGVAVVLLAVLPLALGPVRPVVLAAVLACLGQTGYVVLVGGDWMPVGRFLLPVFPALALLAQEGIVVAASRWRPGPVGRLERGFAGLLLGLILLSSARPWLQSLRSAEARRTAFAPDSDLGQVVADAPEIGRTLDRVLPPRATVAIEWGGIVPYFMQQNALEYFGLTDRAIAASSFPASSLGRWTPIGYLAERHPEMVIPCVKIFRDEAALGKALSPGGFCRGYRGGFYFGLERPEFGYHTCAIPSAHGAFIALARKELPCPDH